MKKGIFILLIISSIGLTSTFLFLSISKNSQEKDQVQLFQGEDADFAEIVGRVNFIREDYMMVTLINNQIDEKNKENLSTEKSEELKLGIDGATPVFIFNNNLGMEKTSQMAELKWDDYVLVQYNKVDKKVKKLIILENEEAAIKKLKS